jgi:L-iditol 2-dehydrogenase
MKEMNYMKAVVKAKPGYGIEVITDAAVPKPRRGEVLIHVEAVGICGSDLHIYEWTPGYESIAPYFPRIIGHEFSGEIIEVGSGSESLFNRGEKVTSETCKSCGQCFYCKQGNGILCLHRFVFGRIGFEREGAMAEYVVVSEECLHRIPPGVTMEEAAMTEPAAVALGAVERGGFCPGDLVVISGPGPIGLITLQLCKVLGAGRVVVIGLKADRHRLEIATKLGADAVLTGLPEENLQIIMEWTGGLGAATCFEVSGAPEAAAAGLQMLRRFGDLVLVGIYPDTIPIDATRLVVRQMKSIKGSYGGMSLDWERVLNLVSAGRIELKPLISKIIPLQDAQEGFEILRKKDALKVLLRP